jgi:hypothetical protein
MYGRFERKNRQSPGQKAYQSSAPRSQQLAQPKTPPLSGAPIRTSPNAPPVANVPPQNVQQQQAPQQLPSPQQQQSPMVPSPQKVYPGMKPAPMAPKAPMPQGMSDSERKLRQQAIMRSGGQQLPAQKPMGAQFAPAAPSPQTAAIMNLGKQAQAQQFQAPPKQVNLGQAMYMSQAPGFEQAAKAMADADPASFQAAAAALMPQGTLAADGDVDPRTGLSKAALEALGGYRGGKEAEGITPEDAQRASLSMAMAGMDKAAKEQDQLGWNLAGALQAIEDAYTPGGTMKPGADQAAEAAARQAEQDAIDAIFAAMAAKEQEEKDAQGAIKKFAESAEYADDLQDEVQLKGNAAGMITDLMSDTTPGIFSEAELAQQILDIDKGMQAQQAAVSQAMGARGFGASGVAGANLGNIAAAAEAAKTQLMVEDRAAGIERQLGLLNQVSSLYGNLLGEEGRRKIAEMQESLEREKFEYGKEQQAESDKWSASNNIMAMMEGDYYSGATASMVGAMVDGGMDAMSIMGLLEVDGNGQMVFKNPSSAAKMAAEMSGVDVNVSSTDPTVREAQLQFAQAVGYSVPAPDWTGGDSEWQALSDFQKEERWRAYAETGGGGGGSSITTTSETDPPEEGFAPLGGVGG